MTKPIRPLRQDVHAVVLVASQQRWRELRDSYDELRPGVGLGHEFLSRNFGRRRVVFIHTGEEPVEAAVSAQYAVDRWTPHVLAHHGGHTSFDHVAERNGFALAPVEELGLFPTASPPAEAEPRVETAAPAADEPPPEDSPEQGWSEEEPAPEEEPPPPMPSPS